MNSVEKAAKAYDEISYQLSQLKDFHTNDVYKRQSGSALTASDARKSTQSVNMNVMNTPMVDIPDSGNLFDQSLNENQFNVADDHTSTINMRFSSRASFDSDYRPYHDALLSLLQSRPSDTKSSLHANLRHESKAFYIKRIFMSAYSRSSQLQKNADSNKNTDAGSLHAKRLELEGHTWSLLASLVADPDMQELLLWQSSSSSTEKVERQIQQFINDVVLPNAESDSANMIELVSRCFGYSLACENNDTKGVQLPLSVKRRQVILEWIEGCHNRSISSQERPMMRGDSSREKKIASNLPDARLLRNVASKSSHHSNDAEAEVTLLSNCLSLMKAGRTHDALELCSQSGNPWRAVAWDGNAAHGSNMEMEKPITKEDSKSENIHSTFKAKHHVDKAHVARGNPQRALWKRSMWQASESFHAMLQQQHEEQLVNGSVVYEAAITAILADNNKAASQNPLLQGWMDFLWIFYHGFQSRFMELVYHSHNNLRRNTDRRENCHYQLLSSDFPIAGAEYKVEEEEQLRCTEELSRLEEKIVIHQMGEKAQGSSGQILIDCVGALLTGSDSVNDYLQRTIDFLLSEKEMERSIDIDEYEQALRFVLHFVLFLDSFYDMDADENTPHYSNTKCYQSIISPRRNELILAYLGQLMGQKPLWEFTCLYASLLPTDLAINACAEFWLVSVVQEEDRRIILKHAQDNFREGMDLVILRNVVRSSIAMSAEDADSLGISSLSGLPDPTMVSATKGERLNPTLKDSIAHNDVRKMHSIRWLCINDQHYAHALVFSNMLLRKMLLESASLNAPFSSYDKLDDWTQDAKVYSAKVFLSRFVPADFIRATNDIVESDSFHEIYKSTSESFCVEHQALVQLLDAHDSYEIWKEVISQVSPCSIFAPDTRFEANGTMESEVAMNMEKMSYMKRKRQNARKVLQVASIARDDILRMLDGGWLSDVDTSVEAISGDEDVSTRIEEVELLRRSCLPTFVFLAFRILYDTGLWMDEFAKEIKDIFDEEEGNIILHRIYSADCRTDGEGDKEMNTLLFSTTWYHDALLLANIVSSTSNGIVINMTKEQVAELQAKFADTSIRLMLAVQEGVPKNNRNSLQC